MQKTRLFTPGPTPLLPRAQEALSRPIIHHRTEHFRGLLLNTRRNLQRIFKTENDVLFLASSGTGAMEAAVRNLLEPGDRALAVTAGKFGERWTEICRTYQIPCSVLSKQSGEAASAEEICTALAEEPEISALLIQGCETSTATSHDLEQIAKSVREHFPDVLLIVDAITAILTQPVHTDEWGLDVVISGSQKAFGVPPGLAFLSLTRRALEKLKSNPSRPYYFDLLAEAIKQRKGQTSFTPAVPLISALHESTEEILDQGVDRIIAEAELMARATRRGLEALGFRLLSSSAANALTAAFPPPKVAAVDLRRELENHFGILVAGGQGELKEKIIRIAHLGYFDVVDVFSVLSAIEICLDKMEASVELGSSLRAAMLAVVGREASKTVG